MISLEGEVFVRNVMSIPFCGGKTSIEDIAEVPSNREPITDILIVFIFMFFLFIVSTKINLII
tara:strand:- start:1176 stop:1364 length:189 start_codon:yes stop_codon:yes gene_type:complete